MNTVLDQLGIDLKVTRGARRAGERPAALPSPHLRPGEQTLLSLEMKFFAGRPLFVKRERVSLGGYLLGWTAPLSFCAGLCGLAVSSAFEVAVPRWSIVGYGAACVLLALLAQVLSRSWQQLQTSGQPDCGFLMGDDAAALWATGKESMGCFSCRETKRAAVRLADGTSSVLQEPPQSGRRVSGVLAELGGYWA
jgi:hypothetical protein